METKKHSIFSNFIFAWKPLAADRPGAILYFAAEGILFAVLPIAASALSSLVVGLVGSTLSLPVIIVTILMMFLVYGVLNGVYTYLNGRNDMAYIAVRSSYHEMPYLEKHMDISLEQLENNKVRQTAQKAGMALGCNYTGLEGMLRNHYTFFANALGMVFYIVLVGALNIKMILFLLAVSAVTSLVSGLSTKAYEKVKDKIAVQERIARYIDRTVDNVAGGKDIRVFDLSSWLIGK